MKNKALFDKGRAIQIKYNIMKDFLDILILTILGIFFAHQVVLRIIRKIYHFPAPAFIGSLLDSSYRRRLQPPDKLIKRSGIKRNMQVLEIGCGSGAYTTFAARAAGEEGRVYALDIQEDMLKQLEKKLSRPENRDIRNVELVHAGAYELPFEDSSLDLVTMVTVLQEIPDREKALKEVKRVLKEYGILAVSEFFPDPDYPLRSTTVRMGKEAGFFPEEVCGNFWNYTVRFIKRPA
jgi:ubiquinone/menaquinone biosynthesis C-methylase UbiE